MGNNKIKIFINTLPVHQETGGMKTFVLELLHALLRRNNASIEYILICSPSNENIFSAFFSYSSCTKYTVCINSRSAFRRIYFEQFKLRHIIESVPNAILLNICNVAVMRCRFPQVTILHCPLCISALRKKLPSKYVTISLPHKIYYNLFVIRSVKISAKTIVVSEYMRQFLGNKRNHAEVIYGGINSTGLFHAENSREMDINDEPYILFAGTLFPYKNLGKLLNACRLLKQRGFTQKLWIAGHDPDGKQLRLLQNMAKELNIEHDVKFCGYVPPGEMPALYKNAALFVFLSGVETFGLPVLEAMACGVPVIASNKMSLPEIVNNAGILVNPDNIKMIANTMEYVLSSTHLQQSMKTKGLENIKQFDWNITADKFEKVFMDIISSYFKEQQ